MSLLELISVRKVLFYTVSHVFSVGKCQRVIFLRGVLAQMQKAVSI
jgi:ABC-type oligopeptide transport system ATPase subunit